MPTITTRRDVLTSFCLIAGIPNLLFAKDISARKLTPITAEKIIPINNQFCSVNGWVIPTTTLISGAD